MSPPRSSMVASGSTRSKCWHTRCLIPSVRRIPSERSKFDLGANRLEFRGKQSWQQRNQTSGPTIRFILLGMALILGLSYFAFQTSDPIMLRKPARSMRLQPARTPVQQTIAAPPPITQPMLSATLNTNLEFAPAKPDVCEVISNPAPLPTMEYDYSSPPDGRLFVRYLERRTDMRGRLPLLGGLSRGNGGLLAFGNLRAGYGRIFSDNSGLARGRNGTAWEEGSHFYLKTSFKF